MKKYIIGALVGALLMFSVQVAADSWTGKEVQGTFPVYVDGKALDIPAIVVDGNSFLPVRKIGESVNYKVDFDETKRVVRLNDLNAGLSLEDLQTKLKNAEKIIKSRQASIELWTLEIERGNLTDEVKQGKLQRIADEQEKISSMQSVKSSVIAEINNRTNQ